MPRDSAAADRPASYLVGTAAAFPLFFRDRTKPINQLPFSPSAKFPKSGSSCESRASRGGGAARPCRAGAGGARQITGDERGDDRSGVAGHSAAGGSGKAPPIGSFGGDQ